MMGHADRRQRVRQLERRLPAEGDHHAVGLLDVDDVHDVLERERLEVQLVGRVVVVDTVSGLQFTMIVSKPGLVQSVAGVHAAIVELDALADAVGPAPRIMARRRVFGAVSVSSAS